MSSLIIVTVINNNKVTKTSCKHDSDSTFVRISSVLERIFLFFLPPQPVANSGPRDVSAVKECFVPLFDSNMNPAKSSFRIVDCCEIHTHKKVRKTIHTPQGCSSNPCFWNSKLLQKWWEDTYITDLLSVRVVDVKLPFLFTHQGPVAHYESLWTHAGQDGMTDRTLLNLTPCSL